MNYREVKSFFGERIGGFPEVGLVLATEILELELMADSCERLYHSGGGVNGFLADDGTQLIYRPESGLNGEQGRKLSSLGVYGFDTWGRLIPRVEAYYVRVGRVLQLSALQIEEVGEAMGKLVDRLPRLDNKYTGLGVEKLDVMFARGQSWAVGDREGERIVVSGVDDVELVAYANVGDEWVKIVEARAGIDGNTWLCEQTRFWGKRVLRSSVRVVSDGERVGLVPLVMAELRQFSSVLSRGLTSMGG